MFWRRRLRSRQHSALQSKSNRLTRRGLLLEPLEQRLLLAIDSVIDPGSPAYDDLAALLSGEVPAGVTEGDVRFVIEEAEASKVFSVDTLFDPASGLRARLQVADGVDPHLKGLYEFNISLLVQQKGVATYRADVLFPDEGMVSAMHEDRAQAALAIVAEQNQRDIGEILAALGADGKFLDLAEPSEPEPGTSTSTSGDVETSADSKTTIIAEKLDRFAALAGAVATDSVAATDRLKVYAGLERLATDVDSEKATGDDALAAGDRAHHLGAAAYALADRLKADMASSDIVLATAARKAFDAAYGQSDLYFKGWARSNTRCGTRREKQNLRTSLGPILAARQS
jgi:hypothetical protein